MPLQFEGTSFQQGAPNKLKHISFYEQKYL